MRGTASVCIKGLTISGSTALPIMKYWKCCSFIYRQRDTKGLAKSLLKEFGTLEKVFGATSEQICRIPGIGPASARIIALMCEVSILQPPSRTFSRRLYFNGSDLIRYLHRHGKPARRTAAGYFCEQCQIASSRMRCFRVASKIRPPFSRDRS